MVQGSKSRKVAGSGAENAEEDEEDQDYPDAGSSEEDDNVKVPSKRRGKTPTREQRMTTRPQKVWPYLGCLCAACAVLAGCECTPQANENLPLSCSPMHCIK